MVSHEQPVVRKTYWQFGGWMKGQARDKEVMAQPTEGYGKLGQGQFVERLLGKPGLGGCTTRLELELV